ncbi:MAG: hypothetical protein U1D30_11305 [Planctomycetota bacterium]
MSRANTRFQASVIVKAVGNPLAPCGTRPRVLRTADGAVSRLCLPKK